MIKIDCNLHVRCLHRAGVQRAVYRKIEKRYHLIIVYTVRCFTMIDRRYRALPLRPRCYNRYNRRVASERKHVHVLTACMHARSLFRSYHESMAHERMLARTFRALVGWYI